LFLGKYPEMLFLTKETNKYSDLIYSKQKIIPKYLPPEREGLRGFCKNYFGIIF